ncbi:MAG: response regulator [Candidatus Hadarchaeales archaeon]
MKLYKKENPDLVLLDIILPGIDGYTVFEKIKKINPNQKIAFVSALDIGPQAVKKLWKFGMPPYISKPFDPDELVNKVKEIPRK